MQSGKLR